MSTHNNSLNCACSVESVHDSACIVVPHLAILFDLDVIIKINRMLRDNVIHVATCIKQQCSS